MRKRCLLVAVCGCLALSVAGCGGSGDNAGRDAASSGSSKESSGEAGGSSKGSSEDSSKDSSKDSSSKDSGSKETGSKDAGSSGKESQSAVSEVGVTVEEQDLFSNDYISVRLMGYIEDDEFGADYAEILVENKTDGDITVISDAAANGVVCELSGGIVDIAAGKKAKSEIRVRDSAAYAAGLDVVGEVDVEFTAYDSDNNTLFEGSKASFRTTGYSNKSSIAPNEADKVASGAGIDVYSLGKADLGVSDDYTNLVFYFVNKFGKKLSFSIDDVYVGDMRVNTGTYITLDNGQSGVAVLSMDNDDIEGGSIDKLEMVIKALGPDGYDVFDSGTLTLVSD